MQYWGKIIGVAVALLMGGGFWGVVLGLLIGHMFDKARSRILDRTVSSTLASLQPLHQKKRVHRHTSHFHLAKIFSIPLHLPTAIL